MSLSFGVILCWSFFWTIIVFTVVIFSVCLYEENKWNWMIGGRIKKFFQNKKNNEDSEKEEERIKSSVIFKKINTIHDNSRKGILEGQGDVPLENIFEVHKVISGEDLSWILDKEKRLKEIEPKDGNDAFQRLEVIKENFPKVFEKFIKNSEIFKNFSIQIQKMSLQLDCIRESSDNLLKEINPKAENFGLKGKKVKTEKKLKDREKNNSRVTIFDVVNLDYWEGAPQTYKNFLEELNIRNITDPNRSPWLEGEGGERIFLMRLKKVEDHFSKYTSENKKKAADSLSRILERKDIKKRKDIKERIEVLIKRAKSENNNK
jgi:hypothetical protein